jgi:hypothetical protein
MKMELQYHNAYGKTIFYTIYKICLHIVEHKHRYSSV